MSIPRFVKAQQYVAPSSTAGKVEKHIFITKHQLDLCEDGTICRNATHFITIAGDEALKSIQFETTEKGKSKRFLHNGTPVDSTYIQKLIDQADQTALTTIRIPQETVDKINTIYRQMMDSATPFAKRSELKQKIQKITQEAKLF